MMSFSKIPKINGGNAVNIILKEAYLFGKILIIGHFN